MKNNPCPRQLSNAIFTGAIGSVRGSKNVPVGHRPSAKMSPCDAGQQECLAEVSVVGPGRQGTASRGQRVGPPTLLVAIDLAVYLTEVNKVSEAIQQAAAEPFRGENLIPSRFSRLRIKGFSGKRSREQHRKAYDSRNEWPMHLSLSCISALLWTRFVGGSLVSILRQSFSAAC